jgi:hypothetical protein
MNDTANTANNNDAAAADAAALASPPPTADPFAHAEAACLASAIAAAIDLVRHAVAVGENAERRPIMRHVHFRGLTAGAGAGDVLIVEATDGRRAAMAAIPIRPPATVPAGLDSIICPADSSKVDDLLARIEQIGIGALCLLESSGDDFPRVARVVPGHADYAGGPDRLPVTALDVDGGSVLRLASRLGRLARERAAVAFRAATEDLHEAEAAQKAAKREAREAGSPVRAAIVSTEAPITLARERRRIAAAAREVDALRLTVDDGDDDGGDDVEVDLVIDAPVRSTVLKPDADAPAVDRVGSVRCRALLGHTRQIGIDGRYLRDALAAVRKASGCRRAIIEIRGERDPIVIYAAEPTGAAGAAGGAIVLSSIVSPRIV